MTDLQRSIKNIITLWTKWLSPLTIWVGSRKLKKYRRKNKKKASK